MALKLNIIIASTRPGRAGPTIAKWVDEQARLNEAFDVALLDLADFKLPLLDEPAHPRLQQYQHEHTKRWAQAIAPADAFLFVVPEYDFFINAALVNALQFLSVEWAYKVAGVVSYGGVSGGLRSTQELRQLLGNLNVMALPQSVPIPFFAKFINEDQVFMPTEQMTDGLKSVLGELSKWGTALQPLRKG
jgi:NAD(P)H-dependent FMN reductase